MSDFSVKLSVENNVGIARDELEEAIALILMSIGMEAEGFAKMETPVDTGRLRNSITWGTQANEGKQFTYKDDNGLEFEDAIGTGVDARTVVIGSNVEYAEHIEEGGRGYGGKHMLRNALANHKDRYEKITTAALESKK